MTMVLIGGMWLTAEIWEATVTALAGRGQRGVPVELPGQGDGDASATLEDQLAAVVGVVDELAAQGEKPVVVGHSAASTLAWLAADRRPEQIGAVALIGGFPTSPGEAYFDAFPVVDGVVAFPGWEPFEGPDSADLDDAAKAAVAAAAVPVPGGVTMAAVAYTDDRRYDVPVILVCPEFSPDDAQEWIDDGDVPELAAARHLSYVDIDTGHWPMVSAPSALADALAGIAP